MPNGRTHLFEVETAKLLEFLEGVEAEGPIGTLFDVGGVENLAELHVSLAEFLEKVRAHKEPRMTIEEHYWSEYIVHTGQPVGGWVCVDRKSSAFPAIRRLHLDHRLPKDRRAS
jgi:hypothetical protein